MPEFAYDLHIHSCLSPCGDEDMTPANIAGMAREDCFILPADSLYILFIEVRFQFFGCDKCHD